MGGLANIMHLYCTPADQHGRLATALPFILWLTSFSFILGFFIFWSNLWITTIFLPLAYITLLIALLMTSRSWSDWINPLSLIIFVGFIRFSLPGLLSLLGIESDIVMFQLMQLSRNDWLLGHVLALMGLLGVVIGWFLPMRPLRTIFHQLFPFLKSPVYGGVCYSAILGMLLGFIALLLFVGSNAPILEVIYTGEFRGTEIQEGTGKYFYLGLMLISSSVVFSAYLANKGRTWWIVLIPVMVAMTLYWVLGGRARALTPLGAGLLLLWYRRNNLKVSTKIALSGILVIGLLIVFLAAGQLYRGGLGARGIVEALSISTFIDYIKYTVWVDIGQLHSLAGATKLGAGVLEGRTFLALLWPLSEILSLPGKSAGIFITQTLVGFGERKWGFHATLIGDAYLNFGLIGVFIVTTIFGMIFKMLYAEFRGGSISNAFYALFVVYGIRVFFESIEKYGEALVVLCFAFLVAKLGQTVFQISSERGWKNRKCRVGTGQQKCEGFWQ